jgi:hypothetical protein
MKLGGFPERIWRGRWSRTAALLLAFLLLTTIVMPGPRPGLPGPGEAPLVYEPIMLQANNPARRDVGRLHFLGGWELNSPDDRLGGLSALHVGNGEVLAVSDTGMLVSFPLPGTAPAPRVRFRPVVEGPGPRRERRTRDTEGLMVAGDKLWLSFERYNAIWRYDRASLRGESGAQPWPMRGWWSNSGPEAIVRLADGRTLVLEEGLEDGVPMRDAILFAGDPAVQGTPSLSLHYRRPAGYRPTDAALLPDGRILILNRRFAWLRFSAKLLVADIRGLPAGGTIEGQEVATLEAPLVIDNMEGLSVTQENGRTIVWMVSDDDFMRMFRRTLLLKFELRL